MTSILFVAAQVLFAVVPATGLVEMACGGRHRFSPFRLTTQLASVNAFVLLTVLFAWTRSWVEVGLVVVNLSLRGIEMTLWLLVASRTERISD